MQLPKASPPANSTLSLSVDHKSPAKPKQGPAGLTPGEPFAKIGITKVRHTRTLAMTSMVPIPNQSRLFCCLLMSIY